MTDHNRSVMHGRKIGFDPGVLGLTLFPTEKCNFRCLYCYEDFPNIRMSRTVFDSLLALVRSRIAELHTLSIGWFGGEPLLEADTVLNLSSSCKRMAQDHGSNFSSNITTNGFLLTRSLFTQLIEAGVVRFQVSLDGDRESHNLTRRVPGGADGFSTIINNITSFHSIGGKFDVLLRLHAHDGNFDSIVRLAYFLRDYVLADGRFRVTLQKILDHRGDKKIGVKRISRERFADLKQCVQDIIPESSLVEDEGVLQCCYASMPNHFVIRANGKVQKCTVALYDDRNDVGELLVDGTFNWKQQAKLLKWSAGLFEGNLDKMRCPWSYMQQEVSAGTTVQLI